MLFIETVTWTGELIVVVNLLTLQDIETILTARTEQVVPSVKVILTTEGSYPKLLPEITKMSPPRLLIPVLGAIELIKAGISIGVEIEFGMIPNWLIIYTIQDPVTT